MKLPMLLAALGVTLQTQAHRLDEYLQATRVAVSPSRVELRMELTPGLAILSQLMPRIDSDRDAKISRRERKAYARQVIRDLSLTLDGRPLPLKLDEVTFPGLSEIQEGEGMIRLRMTGKLNGLKTTAHTLVFRNGHEPGISVYLVNALQPASKSVVITRQTRDEKQREYALEFELK